MSRFRELVAECERDELEQTQDIDLPFDGAGIWKIEPTPFGPTYFLHTELSMEQHR